MKTPTSEASHIGGVVNAARSEARCRLQPLLITHGCCCSYSIVASLLATVRSFANSPVALRSGHAFLLPFADSLNYGLSCVTCDFSHQEEDEGPVFGCWADCNIDEGEALVWQYSSKSCRAQSVRSWGMYTDDMCK